jgi:flagellar protein FliJ
MASLSQLETLIDLAQRATDDAAKRLGAALSAVQAAEQQLQMLLSYRDDYAARFETTLAGGMTPSAYRNFQAFMGKLDAAIAGQQEVLRHARRRGEAEKDAWQGCERKRMSYTTLESRAQQAAQQVEAKRDQKLMDEHAARQAYYKR